MVSSINTWLWGSSSIPSQQPINTEDQQNPPVQQISLPLPGEPIRKERPAEAQQEPEIQPDDSVSQVARQMPQQPSVVGYPAIPSQTPRQLSVVGYPPIAYQMPQQPSVVGYPPIAYQMPQQASVAGYAPIAYQMPQQPFLVGYPPGAYQMQQPGYPAPNQVPELPAGIGPSIGRNLRDYWTNPIEKITRESSLKCVAYSLAIKISGLFIALIFPFLGYMTFGMSVALIDRVIILNFRNFIDKLPLLGWGLNQLFPHQAQLSQPMNQVQR
ncbi:MAG: hypothetical protein WCT85_06085 [Parachlamydiales bacterium]